MRGMEVIVAFVYATTQSFLRCARKTDGIDNMEVASTNKTKTSHPSAALPRERWLCPLHLLAERLVYEHLHLMSSGLVSVVSLTFYFKNGTFVQCRYAALQLLVI